MISIRYQESTIIVGGRMKIIRLIKDIIFLLYYKWIQGYCRHVCFTCEWKYECIEQYKEWIK